MEDKEKVGNIKLSVLDKKIRGLDDKLQKSLTTDQKALMTDLFKYMRSNNKKPKDWKYRTGIIDAQRDLSNSWTYRQNVLIKNINNLMYEMQDIYKSHLNIQVRIIHLIKRYRLYYIN
jgi:ribulose bisphosphate carboxylase small subunit